MYARCSLWGEIFRSMINSLDPKATPYYDSGMLTAKNAKGAQNLL